MSGGFVKLYSAITESTVWCEPHATRIVWITLLAMADRNGRVSASVPGLANRARVTLEECERALARFQEPDRYSRTPDHDGRRIAEIEGGWVLLNYAKYRAMRDQETRREYQREWDRTHRGRGSRYPTTSDNSDQSRPKPTQAEAEAEAEKLNPLSGVPPDDARPDEQKPKANPNPKREAGAVAERAIAYLNEKAGTRFKAVEANLKLPAARVLYDGATEQDLRAVVDLKVAETARGDFDRKYLRPATLFNAEKFAQYVGQVNARPPSAGPREDGAKVYAEREDGARDELKVYSASDPEQAARAALAEYASAPWMRSARNLVVRANGAETRFSINELRGTP